jgi:hypothetical protein
MFAMIHNINIEQIIESYFDKCGGECNEENEEQLCFMKNSTIKPCGQFYTLENCTCDYASQRTQIVERTILEYYNAGSYETFICVDNPERKLFSPAPNDIWSVDRSILQVIADELEKYGLNRIDDWLNKSTNREL